MPELEDEEEDSEEEGPPPVPSFDSGPSDDHNGSYT
jgi:hypothetical protein